MSASPAVTPIAEHLDNEERFKAIADNCPSMMFGFDAEGNIWYFNRAARRFSGTDQENLDAGEWQAMIHPADALEFIAFFKAAIRDRIPFSAEARVRRFDGEWRVLGSRAEPRFSSNGEYLGHIGLSADITERIQTEKSRRFEVSLNRAIQDETLQGILVVNSSGEVVSRNKRYLEVWGLPDSASTSQLSGDGAGASGQPLLQALINQVEDQESYVKRVRELKAQPDEKDRCEIRLKDGRTLERHSTGLRDENGNYLGRVLFARDITAHKQAEASLQHAKDLADEANRRLREEQSIIENERKMLHALIDNIPDYMYVKDLESRFVVANPHLARVVGVKTPEELLGKTDFDFFSKEIADAFYQDEQDVMRSGQPLFNREEKGVDSNGNEVYILTTKVPIRDSEGQVIGMAGVGRDISTRKRMEIALHEAERNYHGIFDNAIVGIFQSTPAGRFLSVNSSMASTCGYDSPEDMVASITDIAQQFYVNPKRRTEFIQLSDTQSGVLSFECEAYRKDRSKVWLSLSVRTIFQDGKAVRYEGMCEDITERFRLREQLLQAQKLESVGHLAAGIAHEINTPTQYIGDNVRFMKDAFEDMKHLLAHYERLLLLAKSNTMTPEAIQEIEEAINRADAGYLLDEIPKAVDQTLEGITRVSTIVSAMKDFSHPGTKEKIPVDLNHAIASTITVARNEWKYVADLETDFDLSLPPILCLPGELNQVILNLIVNAAHAIANVIPEGGSGKGKIRVQTLSLPEWAEIRVQDTGSGIPEEIRSKVFDPFFTTKEIGKGTGQGLAIARSVIVDKHEGTIHFETKTGSGTTFIIRLPREKETLAPKAVAA
jgi:two-component system, NtrC family, sensor kinase